VAGFAEVSDILWRERELLDVLLFKLDQERLLLADSNVRWLARATREIDLVLEQLRLTEITRAMEVDALAGEVGLAPGASLAGLAAAAPSPWAELFAAHRDAFVSLTDQIAAAADANRHSLDDALRTTRDALRELGGDRRETAS
jgi:transcription initiation factor TFIIIB Brf1 subunit/transcription initiation factor TFIIB